MRLITPIDGVEKLLIGVLDPPQLGVGRIVLGFEAVRQRAFPDALRELDKTSPPALSIVAPTERHLDRKGQPTWRDS
jgi:hypothetical protein